MTSSIAAAVAIGLVSLSLAACSTDRAYPRDPAAPTPGSRAEALILPPDPTVSSGPGERAGRGMLSYSTRNAVHAHFTGPRATGWWTMRSEDHCITQQGRPDVCFSLYQTGADTYALWRPNPIKPSLAGPAR